MVERIPGAILAKGVRDLKMLPAQQLNSIFLTTVQATEVAVNIYCGRSGVDGAL